MQDFKKIIDSARKKASNTLQTKGRIFPDLKYEDYIDLFQICGIQSLIERNDFSDQFNIDDENSAAIKLFYNYLKRDGQDNINPFGGIILNGAYGCGKSVLISTLCKVLNLLHNEWGETIKEIHAIELAEQIRINGVLPYAHCPLCIQDLGKEPDLVNTYGQKYKPITNLLAIRAENGALTFGSTNMDLDTFGKFYDEYIKKRITEHVNIIFLPGKSRRKNYAINQPK